MQASADGKASTKASKRMSRDGRARLQDMVASANAESEARRKEEEEQARAARLAEKKAKKAARKQRAAEESVAQVGSEERDSAGAAAGDATAAPDATAPPPDASKSRKRPREDKAAGAAPVSDAEPRAAATGARKSRDRAAPRGRHYTVSVAVPGSLVSHAKTLELRTLLAGQIARACVCGCVDEVVVYADDAEDEEAGRGGPQSSAAGPEAAEEEAELSPAEQAAHFVARVLQYLETPQYVGRHRVDGVPHAPSRSAPGTSGGS